MPATIEIRAVNEPAFDNSPLKKPEIKSSHCPRKILKPWNELFQFACEAFYNRHHNDIASTIQLDEVSTKQ
jgi:hypothetical protein